MSNTDDDIKAEGQRAVPRRYDDVFKPTPEALKNQEIDPRMMVWKQRCKRLQSRLDKIQHQIDILRILLGETSEDTQVRKELEKW